VNPWAGLIVAISIVLFIIAYKNTQDNLIAATLGRSYGNSTLYGSSSGSKTKS
jgi:hypothetical protein